MGVTSASLGSATDTRDPKFSHSDISSSFLQDASNYVNELVKPVLSCFFDSDSRVRYYGCESLYNIVKVARSSVLPFFNDIFDGLSKVSIVPFIYQPYP